MPASLILVGVDELPPSWDPVVTPNFDNSWPEISKFQNKPFPLYDKLGDLYDGHIAEGNYNFTSTEVTQVSNGDPEGEREETAFSFDRNQYDDDLHMYDDPRNAAQTDDPRDAAQTDDPREANQNDGSRDAAQRGAADGSNKKHVKEPRRRNEMILW